MEEEIGLQKVKLKKTGYIGVSMRESTNKEEGGYEKTGRGGGAKKMNSPPILVESAISKTE